MSYAYAHEYSYRHKHRRRHRRGLRGLLKRLHEPHKLFFYLCLLIAGCALFGAAIHYYYLGHENEARGTLAAIDQAGNDYTRTIVLSVVGLLPFGLGVRGEMKRKQAAELRAQLRKAHNRTKPTIGKR